MVASGIGCHQKTFIIENLSNLNINIQIVIKDLCLHNLSAYIHLINHPIGYFRYLSINIVTAHTTHSQLKHMGWQALREWGKRNILKHSVRAFWYFNLAKKNSNGSDVYKWLATCYYYGIGCNINFKKSHKYFSLSTQPNDSDDILIQCASGIKIDPIELLYIVKGIDNYKKAWYIVLVRPSCIFLFLRELENIKTDIIHLNDYSIVIKCKYGDTQPKESEIICKFISKDKHTLQRVLNTNYDHSWTADDFNQLKFDSEDDIQKTCPICMDEEEDVRSENNWMCFNCGALFHKVCYDSWIKIKSTCPMCRSHEC